MYFFDFATVKELTDQRRRKCELNTTLLEYSVNQSINQSIEVALVADLLQG